jgi:D-aminopeptidase
VKTHAFLIALALIGSVPIAAAQTGPRARDLGVPFEGTAGPLNSITDVKGVEVGYRTLISGEGKLQIGVGPVRTGVTAIFPRGKNAVDPVFAGWFTENGNGEMTGTTWVEESGFLYGPVMIQHAQRRRCARRRHRLAAQTRHPNPARRLVVASSGG